MDILDTGETVVGDCCFRELICSYKVIYLNTMNVVSIDLESEFESRIVYRYESF